MLLTYTASPSIAGMLAAVFVPVAARRLGPAGRPHPAAAPAAGSARPAARLLGPPLLEGAGDHGRQAPASGASAAGRTGGADARDGAAAGPADGRGRALPLPAHLGAPPGGR